ncbi:hypothetical protein GQ457_12G012130 [Hibiscus cannabinus]
MNSQAKEGFNVSKSHSKENHGLRLQKGSGSWSSNHTLLSKWLPSTINMVDDEARQIQHGLEFDYDVMDDDDPREANDGARNCVDSVASASFRRYFKNLVNLNKPRMGFLLETRISGRTVDKVLTKLSFCNSFRVEARDTLLEWIHVTWVYANPVAKTQKLL